MTSLQLYLKENHEIALQGYKLDESNILVIQCREIVLPLQEEFEKFCQYDKQTSELRRYLHLSKIIIEYLKDLIAADWSGNWHAHLQSIKNLLPLFREFDSINCLHCTWNSSSNYQN